MSEMSITERQRDERLGQIFKADDGSMCEIISYTNTRKVRIRFLDKHGHEVETQYGNIKRGKIRNPYQPSVVGVGYIGVGKYNVSEGGKTNREYVAWENMLRRCYCERYHELYPTYVGCSASEEWHNFQNFAKWFDESGGNEREDYVVDKDILVPENKVYSKDTARLVPSEVNSVVTVSMTRAKSSGLPVGVQRKGKKYRATLCRFGKQIILGSTYETPEDAFYAYKVEKEKHVKEVANMYIGEICADVYEALLRWKIDIDY